MGSLWLPSINLQKVTLVCLMLDGDNGLSWILPWPYGHVSHDPYHHIIPATHKQLECGQWVSHGICTAPHQQETFLSARTHHQVPTGPCKTHTTTPPACHRQNPNGLSFCSDGQVSTMLHQCKFTTHFCVGATNHLQHHQKSLLTLNTVSPFSA